MQLFIYIFIITFSLAYHLWDKAELIFPKPSMPLMEAGFDTQKLFTRSRGETNSQVLRKLADIKAIASLNLPLPNAQPAEWTDFQDNILSIHAAGQSQGSRFRPINHDSELIGFVAYMAKHKPELTMEWVDSSVISIGVFNHLVQMGLLKNWFELSKNPDFLVKSSQIGLLRFALDKGLHEAEQLAIEAFLRSDQLSAERNQEVSLVNLRFAIDAMQEQQLQRTLNLLKNKQITIDVNHIRQIMSVYPKQAMLEIIQSYANPKKNYQNYVFDAAKLGDQMAVSKVIEDYTQHFGDTKVFRSKSYQHYSSCPICTLALNTDGVILSNGEDTQNDQLRNFQLNRDNNGKLIILDSSERGGIYEQN